MNGWFRSLDRILRGEATRLPDLMRQEFQIPVLQISLTIIALAAFYGACMGVFGVVARWTLTSKYAGYEQVLSSMVKVPMLFVLTLLVTFPSLYVFNALVGSRLGMLSLFRLLVAALSVMVAVLASFGLIAAFFALSTTSHPFMIVLNTVIFTVSGCLGLAFLLRTLQRLSMAQRAKEYEDHVVESRGRAEEIDGASAHEKAEFSAAMLAASGADPGLQAAGIAASTMPPAVAPMGAATQAPRSLSGQKLASPEAVRRAGALDRVQGSIPHSQVNTVFRIWIIVFALVGAQMAWILRPFIGDPSQPFTFFGPRDSNFFAGVLTALMRLFGADVG
jgi:hypothetical protein